MSNQNSLNQEENYVRLIESQRTICGRHVDIYRIDKNAGDFCFAKENY